MWFLVHFKVAKCLDSVLLKTLGYNEAANEDIEVEFKNESKANIDKESGILRWSLNVSAKSEEKIKFSYKVKFPSDKPLYVDWVMK